MSQADVVYSCGSCGYLLNLSSSNQITYGINSKSDKKGVISFFAVDLSRFTQVDEVNCLPVTWGRYRSKTKLLCRKCGVLLGYGYGESALICGFDPASYLICQKYSINIHALQPLEESYATSFLALSDQIWRVIIMMKLDFAYLTIVCLWSLRNFCIVHIEMFLS